MKLHGVFSLENLPFEQQGLGCKYKNIDCDFTIVAKILPVICWRRLRSFSTFPIFFHVTFKNFMLETENDVK